jgi:hypothetical protein
MHRFKNVVLILIIKEEIYVNVIKKLPRRGKCKASDKEMTAYQNLLQLLCRTVHN